MNAFKLSFCFGLGFIAYKSFSKDDLKILYKITIEKFDNVFPYFKNVINNFNNLLTVTNNFANLTNNDEINKKIIKLNESIKEINNEQIKNINFKKI